jgi:hypothetical protein
MNTTLTLLISNILQAALQLTHQLLTTFFTAFLVTNVCSAKLRLAQVTVLFYKQSQWARRFRIFTEQPDSFEAESDNDMSLLLF